MSFDHEAFWSARYRDAGENYLFGIAPNKFLAAQAERFGAVIQFGEVTSLEKSGKKLSVVVDDKDILAKSISSITLCLRTIKIHFSISIFDILLMTKY